MNQVEQILREKGCVATDDPNKPMDERVHLVLSSGKHSNGYVNADPVTPHPSLVESISIVMWSPEIAYLVDSTKPVVFIGPEKGVNAFLYNLTMMAYRKRMMAGRGGELNVYTLVVEKRKTDDGNEYYVDRTGHAELCQGASLIGVEDVSTTGGSLGGALAVGIANGGIPMAGACMYNRGGVTAEMLGLPPGSFHSAVQQDLPMWAEADCPLCTEGVPIALDLGHGERFRSKHPNYAGGFTNLFS